MLGRLARAAIARGDRDRAQRYLSWMAPWSPELDMDSELRLSAAALATLDRDGRRVLALLGGQKDAIPIADSMDALATVFRANAYEMLGDPETAARTLRELPEARMLPLVCNAFSSLRLCQQSASAYTAATTHEAARRAASSAEGFGLMFGVILVLTALLQVPFAFVGRRASYVNLVIGAIMALVGVAVAARAQVKGKHAAWLRVHGLSLAARILSVEPTGTRINNVPMCRVRVEVAGPDGPYSTSFDKLVPEHQLAMLAGGDVRVRANPGNLQEVILEE